MATAAQLNALQKILDIAEHAGLNKPQLDAHGRSNNRFGKGNSASPASRVGNLEAFNFKLSEICQDNASTAFLVYVHVDADTNHNHNNNNSNSETLSTLIRSQLSNNVLSSIECVASTERFAKYKLLIYRLSLFKIAIVFALPAAEKSKTENISLVQDMAASIQAMILGACGQPQQHICIAVTARKKNEDEASLLSRAELLLKKGRESDSTVRVATDAGYFGPSSNASVIATANDGGASSSSSFTAASRGNEIVTVCVGGTGTGIGQRFYELIMAEHGLNAADGTFGDGGANLDDAASQSHKLDKIGTYFSYSEPQKKFIPRTFFVDMDASNLDALQNRSAFMPQTQFCGYDRDDVKSNDLWSQGCFTVGREMHEKVVQNVRATMESCDCAQGFQFMASTASGFEAGFVSLLQTQLKDLYPKKIRANFAVFPDASKLAADDREQSTIQIYNHALSVAKFEESSDLVFPLADAQLSNICRRTKLLGLQKKHAQAEVSPQDLQWLSALVVSGVTAPLRFYGEPQILSNMRRMQSTFQISLRCAHLAVSHAPFLRDLDVRVDASVDGQLQKKKKSVSREKLTVPQIKGQLLSSACNASTSVDLWKTGKVMQFETVFRCNNGKMASDMEDKMRSITAKRDDDKLQIDPSWFQSACIFGQCDFYDAYTPLIATSVTHSTGIARVYDKVKKMFSAKFKKKDAVGLYYNDGMEAMEFTEAETKIAALISSYNDLGGRTVPDDDDDDGDDDDDEEEEDEDDD